ncbi:MAG TPA: universal stress protein, partial [Gammaproteobacteria bacterium]|nr:universal stress protein [Gammaproteobacteria bacterium]
PVLRLAMSYTISSEEKEAYLETERAQAVRNLAGFLSGLSTTQCDRVLRHARTTPANEILAAADELVADLIVVGTRGASGFTRLLLGSVAEEVLRRARRDVLAVPPVRARG